MFHPPFFAQLASSKPGWAIGVVLAGLLSTAPVAAADEQRVPVVPPPTPNQEQAPARTPAAEARTEQSTVITPPSTQPASAIPQKRPITYFTIGPWGALISDGLVTPEFVRFGWRAGALLTLHQLIPGFQEVLRLSVARVESDPIWRAGRREAELAWTSVRLDACHGWSAKELSMVAACALLDVGGYSGVGHVDGNSYKQHAILGRAGAAAYLRKQIWSGFALHADLGVMVPFKRPRFYFEANAGLPSEEIFQIRQLGLVADVGLEMHFW